MASKQIRDECKIGEAIAAAGRSWACEIANRRGARLTALGLGGAEVEAAIAQAIERDMSALALSGERLQDADTALDRAESVGPGLLARRDEACQRAYDHLVQMREVVATFAGAAAAREVGFVGTTPRDPVAVEELAGRVLAFLPRVTLTPRLPGVTLDLAPSTAELAIRHDALVKANADALEAKHGEQLARSRRDELWAEYTRERTSTGLRLTADLRAVGLADVAERLLPTTRKVTAAEGETDATKSDATRPEKKSARAAKGAKTKQPTAEVKAAAPAATPAINTRPSLAPAPPS